jgi:hypothetical protein
VANSFRIVAVALGLVGCLAGTAGAQSTTFRDAQRLFYSARFEAAADLAATTSDTDGLPASELRSSALLFQLRRTFGEPKDKDAALKQCAACGALTTAFLEETRRGQAMARARLESDPADEAALFYLGKLDLNYVWLQLGTFGRRTGWSEYWEARRSLDAVLKRSPEHVRARVARAWIDYIVDTKLPRGTRWMLGGGNKKKGLRTVEQAAKNTADFFAQAEAAFALWDMQVREKNLPAAVVTARSLSRDFPDNLELVKFLANNDPNAQALASLEK